MISLPCPFSRTPASHAGASHDPLHPLIVLAAMVGAGNRQGLCCALIDGLSDQIALLGKDGTIIAVNQSWRSFAADGRKAETAVLHTDVGTNYLTVCRDASAGAGAAAAAGIGAVLDGGTDNFCLEYDCHQPGRQRWFRMTVTPLAHGWGGAMVVHQDITAQREAEAGWRIGAVAMECFEGVMVTDAQGVILRVNRGFTRITGYSAEEVLGRRPSMLSSGRHDAAFYRQMWTDMRRDGHWSGEIWNRRKDGEIYPELLSIAVVGDTQGQISHYVAVLSDITQRKADSDAIRELAFYDALTGLPNRRLLLERLGQQLRARERRDSCGALLFIDLDNFKSLNDRLGHNVGDLLLQQVAQRLLDCVREADTVARLGGDEFVVLCDGLGGESAAVPQVTVLGNKLLAALGLPYALGKHICHSTPSIGVTLFHPAESVQPDQLLMQADMAMYQAKQAGRNSLRFFDQNMQDNINLRTERERLLRSAIALQQFELHYQVQVRDDGRACGVEALLRWRRADGVLEAAAQFIGLAEETGLLAPLGDWVIEQACAQLRAWRDRPALGALVLSVNIGAAQWRQPDFCERVGAAVARHGIDPSQLRLELREALLFKQAATAVAGMLALARTGIRFAIDDFGIGYSSLQHLRRMPLDQLKIDASFVGGLGIDSGIPAVVRAIVGLASGLGLDVIAEGVETPLQRDLLYDLGCHCYQGRWHSPPLPLAEFEALALLSATATATATRSVAAPDAMENDGEQKYSV